MAINEKIHRPPFFCKNIPYRAKVLKDVRELKEKYENDVSEKHQTDKPDEYKDMTFLYIRATEDDNGSRPIDETYFWFSPDITIYSSTGGVPFYMGVEPGHHYTVECVVHNDGDVEIPAAIVEIRLANVSIAPMPISSTKLIDSKTVNLPAFATRIVTFNWTSDYEDAGNRCMFGRVYSMAPFDAPENWDLLDTRNDRHVGQWNLLILAEYYDTEVDGAVHLPKNSTKHGQFNFNIRPVKRVPLDILKRLSNQNIRSIKSPNIWFDLVERKAELKKNAHISLKRQKQINTWLVRLKGQNIAPLKLKVPKLKLKKNEGAIYEISSIDTKTKNVLGGFTLVVVKNRLDLQRA